jgi:hypothetical protein
LLCAALIACTLALLVPTGASASNTITCSGATKLAERSARTPQLTFGFKCNEDLTGFTIATNREVATFEPEVLVTVSAGGAPAQGESFGCEGAIPGWGFSCPGTSSAHHYVSGAFETSQAACSKKAGTLLPRLIVTDGDGRISQPFALKSPKCPKAKKHKKRRSAKRH